MKCLEKDRTRRYESVSGLAGDLMRYLTDQPVEAGPPSAFYRLAKFARRNRVALTTAGVVGLALLAGTAVSTWQAFRATSAEQKSQEQAQLAQRRREEAEAQKRQAEALLARSLIRSGVQRIREGTAMGLFDLIDAYAAAESDPAARASAGRLWATCFAPLEDKLALVLEGGVSLAFSPGGALLATAKGESVQLWEVATGRRFGPPLQNGASAVVINAMFSPDGKTIATATRNGPIRLWETATGRQAGELLGEDGSKVDIRDSNALAFSPDGKLFVAGAFDGTVRIWDVATRKLRSSHSAMVPRSLTWPSARTVGSWRALRPTAKRICGRQRPGSRSVSPFPIRRSTRGVRPAPLPHCSSARTGGFSRWAMRRSRGCGG